jgi:4-hydroxybenzoate polyprenyltransferase
LSEYIKLLRPHQWTKNILCYAGLIFSGLYFQGDNIFLSSLVFVIFSLTSSSVYILNDIVDIKKDQCHPKKKYRPIASGNISIRAAQFLGVSLALFCLFSAYYIDLSLLVIIGLYFLNNIFYTIYFKHIPIIDVLSIAFGFEMRLFSGIYILADKPTAWIVLCVMFLAMFLGFSKRRAEMASSKSWSMEEVLQRPVLRKYDRQFLELSVNNTALASILAYSIFTTLPGNNPTLIFTVPIVIYAIMHYQQITISTSYGEEPDVILLTDWKLIASVILWLTSYILITIFNIHQII